MSKSAMKFLSKLLLFAFLVVGAPCYPFFQEPWLGQWMEFQIQGEYGYNFFRHIQNASVPLTSTYHTQELGLEFGVSFLENWDGQIEMEFAKTYSAFGNSFDWGYRSFALQIRKAWLDDVAGDPISLCTGLIYRNTSSRLEKAFSTPYHSTNNLEIHLSIGKEWSSNGDWNVRCFGLGAFGQGTSGYPWLRAEVGVDGHFFTRHQLKLSLDGYFGLGSLHIVPTLDFDGWARIAHRSIDLKIGYLCNFDIYGFLSAAYTYRIYAHSYPQGVNQVEIRYTFPFSFF